MDISFPDRQQAHWDAVAGLHNCSLEPPLEVLTAYLPPEAKLIDIGCGYGRSLALLATLGFSGLTGFDPSVKMIERGRREFPRLDLRVWDTAALPVPDGAFDGALLIGVLTGVPEDMAQVRLLSETARVLRPGGVLLLCDFPLQDDERNRIRYDAFEAKYGRRGVLEVGSGAVMRHHDLAWLAELTGDFERLEAHELDARTLYGNPAKALNLILRKPAG
jgi:SAM-dependent methyltransferase